MMRLQELIEVCKKWGFSLHFDFMSDHPSITLECHSHGRDYGSRIDQASEEQHEWTYRTLQALIEEYVVHKEYGPFSKPRKEWEGLPPALSRLVEVKHTGGTVTDEMSMAAIMEDGRHPLHRFLDELRGK